MNDSMLEKKVVTVECTRKTEDTNLTPTNTGTKNVNRPVLTYEPIHAQIQKRIRQRL